jgi:hypothetical protein
LSLARVRLRLPQASVVFPTDPSARRSDAWTQKKPATGPRPARKPASAACNLRCFNDAHVILRKTFVYSHHLTGHDFGTMELDGRTFI